MFNSFKKFPAQGAQSQDSAYEPATPAWSNIDEPAVDQTAYAAPVETPIAPTPIYTPPMASMQRAQQASSNVLNSDVEVIGKLNFVDNLLIDGIVEGEITSNGVLTIGQNARIKAEIRTHSVVIHGKVIGNITVSDRVELKSTAELVGDIHASSLAVEAGAIFIGRSTVGAPTMEQLPTQNDLGYHGSVEQSMLPVGDDQPEENN